MITDLAVHRFIIGGIFIAAGVLHFLKPAMYIRIMPNYIPHHKTMVYISGAAEILGGIGLMIPFSQIVVSWGLIVLLIAVFPANLNMARKGLKRHGLSPLTWVFLLRLPLQFVLIYWVFWAGF